MILNREPVVIAGLIQAALALAFVTVASRA
jgi:hypothetical protein